MLGAGPRGVGVLERLAANLAQLDPGRDVVVHLVDPHPPGAGRIWRRAQSPLLKLNSMARDVTMFTDESCTIDGPVLPGPSLVEWAAQVRSGEIDLTIDDPVVAHELEHLAADSFPTRRLQSEYLAWFYRRAVAALPATVVEHGAVAVRVDDAADGTQTVTLDSGATLDVDIVLYALGHTGAAPEPQHAALTEFAHEHGLLYIAPDFTADADTSAIVAGEPVIVRGMGLAAVDLTVLLTEGRGGRFVPSSTLPGQLDYLPSGDEPHLLLGSRRGVPYHSKISSTLAGPRPDARYFTAAVAKELEASNDTLDFRGDVWPLIAKELLWGYYHELFVGHPDRVRVPWESFVPFLDRYRWNSSRLRAAVDAAVPNPVDRLDLERFDRPLDGERVASRAELQDKLRYHIGLDLHTRSAPEHSATLGLFTSALYALFDLGTIVDSPKWTARSRAYDLPVWWQNYFSYIASGPPAHRLDELLALSRAGVVEFLGPDLTVRAHPAPYFAASSPIVDGEVRARVLVDARLPVTTSRHSDNPALRSLVESGVGGEELVADADFTGSTGRLVVRVGDARVITPDGSPHPRRFAVGPYTNAPFVGAFSRPGTNAVSFRENDRVARAVLELARSLARELSPA
ncbi:FAD/NAD(P)-binding protein [Conyzicola lurida]